MLLKEAVKKLAKEQSITREELKNGGRKMVFKDVVKRMLKEHGMTQKELADRLGFETQGGLASTLGRTSIKLDMVLKILDQFGYTLAIVKKDEMNLQLLKMKED